jgi:hypothetical protein
MKPSQAKDICWNVKMLGNWFIKKLWVVLQNTEWAKSGKKERLEWEWTVDIIVYMVQFDVQFWWECAWEGDRLKRRIGGCLDEVGTRMEIGQKTDSGQIMFQCQQSAERAIKLVAIGCITDKGEHHRIGQQWKASLGLFRGNWFG